MQESFILYLYSFIILNLTVLSSIFFLKKNFSNRILSMYIFAHVCVLSICLLLFLSYINPHYFVFVCLPAGLVGPLLYMYIRSLFLPKETCMSPTVMLHGGVSILMFFMLIIFNFFPVSFINMTFDAAIISGSGDFPFYLKFYILIHVPFYIGVSYIWFISYSKKHAIITSMKYLYAKNFLASLIVFMIFYYVFELSQFLGIVSLFQITVIAPIVVFLLFIFLVFYAINKSPLFEHSNFQSLKTHIEHLQESDIIELTHKVEDIFLQQKLYLKSDLSLKKLAEILHVPIRTLSLYINQEKQTNFSDFVNSFRVQSAQEMLSDVSYDNYTIDAIGELSGFNSRASFYAIFKKHTGCSPKVFKTSSLCNNS